MEKQLSTEEKLHAHYMELRELSRDLNKLKTEELKTSFATDEAEQLSFDRMYLIREISMAIRDAYDHLEQLTRMYK